MNLYIRWNIYASVRISNRNAKLNYYSHKSNHELKFMQEYETSSSGGAGTANHPEHPVFTPVFVVFVILHFYFTAYCLFNYILVSSN